MSITVDIEHATDDDGPEEGDIRRWVCRVMDTVNPGADAEVSIRLVGAREMSALNEFYRGKTGPTNVLSFPADLPAAVTVPLLGDIVICSDVVHREAREQGKTAAAHWAHMVVHGALHLLGYDHVADDDAAVMEALETRILHSLDVACPYRHTHPADDTATSETETL